MLVWVVALLVRRRVVSRSHLGPGRVPSYGLSRLLPDIHGDTPDILSGWGKSSSGS